MMTSALWILSMIILVVGGSYISCSFFKIFRQKKLVAQINAFKEGLKTEVQASEERLKKIYVTIMDENLSNALSLHTQATKKMYEELLSLAIDNEWYNMDKIPKIINEFILKYDQLVELSSTILISSIAGKDVPESVALEDEFQYQALIEQLRTEKQNYADENKQALKFLRNIVSTYKDNLSITVEEDVLKKMNLKKMMQLFNLETQ